LPAELTLANGGATVALLPARYAETVEHGDDAARLGRKTEWLDSGLPVGQRLFATDAGETALFDLRELDFEPTDA
ncbi:type VI secretion system accessory protein TagJ, partial [Pseudomonas aeruginosa]|nr:type VI secretion system accessory protein TagJ [Pseudomonas aeruginosa]